MHLNMSNRFLFARMRNVFWSGMSLIFGRGAMLHNCRRNAVKRNAFALGVTTPHWWHEKIWYVMKDVRLHGASNNAKGRSHCVTQNFHNFKFQMQLNYAHQLEPQHRVPFTQEMTELEKRINLNCVAAYGVRVPAQESWRRSHFTHTRSY